MTDDTEVRDYEAEALAIVAGSSRLMPERLHLIALNVRTCEMQSALQKIAKGEGRFSVDPLTHAGNTIEDMKEIATDALERCV